MMQMQPITRETVFSLIPPRRPDSHKGSYGTLMVVCGSACYRGAAVLACGGALRSGVGICCLASVEPVIEAVLARYSECTLLPLPSAVHGGISAKEAIPLLLEKRKTAKAVLVGCGMGNTLDTEQIVTALLADAPCPILIDADGLNAIAGRGDDPASLFAAACRGVILTPHVGEMSRLCGRSVEAIKRDPAAVAAEFAAKWGCTLVLKDSVTHIASPDGSVFRNTTGNAGLARGGSGDVLAGIIASFAAQGLSPTDAAVCGVYLHGAAADDCAARRSMAGMLPSDLTEGLCHVFRDNGR